MVVPPLSSVAVFRGAHSLLGPGALCAGIVGFGKWHRFMLESELAPIKAWPDRRLKRQLKGGQLGPDILAELDAAGCIVDDGATVEQSSTWKWKVVDRRHTYVIRDEGDRLAISRERVPPISRLIDNGQREALQFIRGVRDQAFYVSATFRKRWIDRPEKLFINVGAGKWYEPGWKVIDYSGDWYQYGRHFVDYPLDLMKKESFPFAANSVFRFYSEHVFEHVPDDVAGFAFREMYRSLAPGGGVRIVVPDADILYDRFRARDYAFFQPWMATYNVTMTSAFLILVAFHDPAPPDATVERDFAALDKAAFFDRYCSGLGYDYAHAGEHINWFNFEKLERMLREAGFDVVERSAPQQSRFPRLRGKGFDTRPHYSLHVDALKAGNGSQP